VNRVSRDFGMLQWQGSIALVFSAWGFWLWYVRLQRPQDRLLQSQVRAALKNFRSNDQSHYE
jgi:hypothetical protein